MKRRHLAIGCLCVACCIPTGNADAQTAALPNPAPTWLDPTPPEATELADERAASTDKKNPPETTEPTSP